MVVVKYQRFGSYNAKSFQIKNKSLNVTSHLHRETSSMRGCGSHTSQKQGVREFYCMSLDEYLLFYITKTLPVFPFHFTHCDIFSWFGDAFPSKTSEHVKQLWSFPGIAPENSRHMVSGQVHPEASLVVSFILNSTTRKIWAWWCSQRAFTSHLIQNWAKFSISFFQLLLVHVSES